MTYHGTSSSPAFGAVPIIINPDVAMPTTDVNGHRRKLSFTFGIHVGFGPVSMDVSHTFAKHGGGTSMNVGYNHGG